MKYVKGLRWKPGMSVKELTDKLGNVGFQGVQLKKAADTIIDMKKVGAKIYFTFTSNMVTSGLRDLFAQVISLGLADIIVTTVGGIEEDIMKAKGERFIVGSFDSDDVELYEKGYNRVGNLFITNETYENFEDTIQGMIRKLYNKKKVWPTSGFLREIGLMLNDENSILYQAAKHNVPIFCPAITDGALGFHLFLFKQKHKDFMIDVVQDFANILFSSSQDEKKGVISLGGGVSKHHAILSCLLNGGADYAVYMTTASHTSGSMSGATTSEAKSWGKVRDDANIATVIGDVTITFPLVIFNVFEKLKEEGLLNE